MRTLLGTLVSLALVTLAMVQISPATASQRATVRVTYYYATGNPMASGYLPYWGAAACSWNYPMGTVLRFEDGFEVMCLDRGLLGSDGWVDVFAPSRWHGGQITSAYGNWSVVEVVRWGWEEWTGI